MADAPALGQDCMADKGLADIENLLRRVRRAALDRRGLGLVAELTDGRLAGFGQLTLWPRAAEISDLTVGESWRGHGIGSDLVRELTRAARAMGAETVEIGVALRNARVLRLYRSLGFDYGRTLDLDLGSGPEPVMYLWMRLTDAASSG
jgi:ribosomal protein S18 acetylase RimI-like enzyme